MKSRAVRICQVSVTPGDKTSLFSVYLKTVALDQGGEVEPGTGAKILIEGPVEGEQAATAEEAPVVAAAGEHGGIANRQVLPAGMVGDFPEDGVEHERGVGAGAAPTPPPAPPQILPLYGL